MMLLSGCPHWMTDFSCRVAVGQACTQAPQETHSGPGESARAGPGGDALGAGEVVRRGARRDARLEAARLDRQGEGALHLLASAHAAAADDALRRVVGEVGVRLVLLLVVDVAVALPAVAHLA